MKRRKHLQICITRIHNNVSIPTPVSLGFPYGSAGKESACNAGDLGLIPGLGRSPGEGKATHSSILARRSPWGSKESDTTEQLSLSLSPRLNIWLIQLIPRSLYSIFCHIFTSEEL